MSSETFEQRVIKSIQEGDLAELKKCCLGKTDVNRPIYLSKEIPVVSKSKCCPFPSIRAPTPIVYTILCEQEELLQYLIDTKAPDLSVTVNGWAPIHYAAATGSYKCMEVLLKHEFIQQNVDMPVIERNKPTSEEKRSTALHIAATNHCHAQAILLTQESFPPSEIDLAGKSVDPERPEAEIHQGANVTQMSAYGNMPLHIAACQNDWDMCQILLHANDDSTIRNEKLMTAADIAKQRKFDTLVDQLEKHELTPLHVLKERYFPKPEATSVTKEQEDEKSYSEDDDSEVEKLRKMVEALTQTVRQLTQRVAALEAGTATAAPGQPVMAPVDAHQCTRCGAATQKKCSQCAKYFCNTCWPKPPHLCTRP